jgi:choline kinase
MEAIILAAGLGSRLSPITDSIPKSLVPVNGVPIIVKQIDSLLDNGIRDITIVSGYKSKVLESNLQKRYRALNFIMNREYIITNNMYSAYLALKTMGDTGFLMMNADVFFDSSVISSLIEFNAPNAIVVDIGSCTEESMKVTVHNGLLKSISKSTSESDALGNSIDVYKFSSAGGKAFLKKCCEYIEEKKEMKLWSEVAINDIFSEIEFEACPLNGRWFEIDNYEDLKSAEWLFR